MASDDRLVFVQFPHPGREHSLATGLDWSASPEHYRRFMIHSGKAIGTDGEFRGELCFWGEWEAGASKAASLSAERIGMPERVFDVVVRDRPDKGFIQNTDPMVFGNAFFYTNCKQRGNGKLKHMARRSLVLFGSRVNKSFCLDTAFVVGDSTWYSPGEAIQRSFPFASTLLLATTIEPISRANGQMNLRAYRGLMHSDDSKMFSFVPCSTLEKHPEGFARPSVKLIDPDSGEDLVKQGMTQSYRSVERSSQQLEALWWSVVEQIRAQGLMLGVSIEEPRHL